MSKAETCERLKEYLGHRALVPFDVAAEMERDLREIVALLVHFNTGFYYTHHPEAEAIVEKWRG